MSDEAHRMVQNSIAKRRGIKIIVTYDQLKRIRDDAFEVAAKVVEDNSRHPIFEVVKAIRAMKNSTVTITFKE